MGLNRRIIELYDTLSSLEEICDWVDQTIARMEEESDFGESKGWRYWQRRFRRMRTNRYRVTDSKGFLLKKPKLNPALYQKGALMHR